MTYEKPVAKKVLFCYEEQVTASICQTTFTHIGERFCPEDNQIPVSINK